MLCLLKLYGQEAKYDDMKVDTLTGRKLVDIDLVKSPQHKNWFYVNGM